MAVLLVLVALTRTGLGRWARPLRAGTSAYSFRLTYTSTWSPCGMSHQLAQARHPTRRIYRRRDQCCLKALVISWAVSPAFLRRRMALSRISSLDRKLTWS